MAGIEYGIRVSERDVMYGGSEYYIDQVKRQMSLEMMKNVKVQCQYDHETQSHRMIGRWNPDTRDEYLERERIARACRVPEMTKQPEKPKTFYQKLRQEIEEWIKN